MDGHQIEVGLAAVLPGNVFRILPMLVLGFLIGDWAESLANVVTGDVVEIVVVWANFNCASLIIDAFKLDDYIVVTVVHEGQKSIQWSN
jgi:hypothetical protein